MSDRKSKRYAAIMGAIAAHRQEESARSYHPTQQEAPVVTIFNLWGLASRQDRMNQRQFWEMRARPR